MSTKWRCQLAWGNPYTTPPSGMPRIRMAVLCDRPHQIPDEILQAKIPGDGWAVHWEMIEQRPIRRWSQEARARVRQGNLRKRMEKKYPLFAQDFIAAELAARPSYYEGSYDIRA